MIAAGATVWARVSPRGDDWLARLYFLLVFKRRFVINMDNSVPLPDGESDPPPTRRPRQFC